MPSILHSAAVSQVGHVREENQDAVQVHEPDDPQVIASHGRLYALADGMGGHAAGRLASQLALEAFGAAFYAGRPQRAAQNLKEACDAANLEVNRAAQRLQTGRMGTTLTALNLVANRLHIAHIGDTRVYLIRNGVAHCLTQDHTQVGELARLKIISPDKVRQHPRRSILSKSVGMELFVQPDLLELDLLGNDQLIVCCDGVWSVIEDEEFARAASTGLDATQLSQRLVEWALERESDDNVSVIAVQIERLAEGVPTKPAHRWWQAWWPRPRNVLTPTSRAPEWIRTD